MPTYDGGHYFLTVLLPVMTEPVPDGTARTSPLHALRKQLALLPTAAQTPACGGGNSPFARNTRNHFVRFAIIDDVTYNGREQTNALWALLKNINPAVAQPQDHLTCPFLYFAAEFDAASGANAERDSYLAGLWDTMQEQLNGIFTHCVGFASSVNDAGSFAKYIARGQLETTNSFNDYYVDIKETVKSLPVWPADKNLIPAGAGAALFVLGFLIFCFMSGPWGFVAMLLGAAVTAAGLLWAYASVMAAGAKPFPAAPDSNLPTVLKALHLQQAFTRFAIDSQHLAVNEISADALHTAFGNFVVRYQPSNLDGPTQPPGVIGI